jgi:Ig-like domain CHU_C associated/Secretion system C-terminal sorting domain
MKIKYLLINSFCALLLPSMAFSQEKEDQDNPIERQNWERRLTADPKTGNVPLAELENARTDMFRTINRNRSLRINSAIPNVKWAERGPNNVGGRTRALLFDPNDATKKKLWAGGVAGGLWYNNDITDANSAWQKVNDLWDNIAVGWITADPSNSQIMYVGTGERAASGGTDNTGGSGSGGAGIWKTTDGGTNWTRLTSTVPDYVKNNTPAAGWREIFKILVNAEGHVFVLNYLGVFRSIDGGNSWKALTGKNAPPADTPEQIMDIEIGSDGILYISEGYESTTKIYKSTDATVSDFTMITPTGEFKNGRVEIALAPSTKGENQVIYAVSAKSGDTKAYLFMKSKDAGATWTNMKIPVYDDLNNAGEKQFMGDQGTYDLILGTHETNPDILYAGGVAYSVSTDGGDTWLPKMGYSELQELMHVDNHAFLSRPGFPNEAVFGNDGGVYYAPDWATSGQKYPKFQTRNKGYNVTQFFSVDMNNFSKNGIIVAGTQDNGTVAINSKYNIVGSGAQINGGDGGLTFIDKLDSNIVITSYIHVSPKLHKSGPLNKENTEELTPNSDKRGGFINPADYDSPNHTLYQNYTLSSESDTKIVRYKINGTSPNYTTTSSILTFPKVGALSVSFIKLGKTPGNLYIGTQEGDIYKATGIAPEGDLTVELTKIMDKDNTVKGNVSCIDFGTDEKTMVVTKSNYNIKSVFYSTDGGEKWVSKDDTEHGLPNMPIRYALVNPKDPKQVMLATELGVWSTSNITAETFKWEPNNTTLANVRCDMLKYRSVDETVAVATHGRGIFTAQLNQSDPCVAPVLAGELTICNKSTTSLSATCDASASPVWYDANGTTKVFAGATFVTPSLTAKTTYKVRCESTACNSAFVDAVVTVNPALEAPEANLTNVKIGTSATLTATCVAGTPNWYAAATGGKSLGSGSYTTPELDAATSYYVACEAGKNPVCSSTRTTQNVRVQITASIGKEESLAVDNTPKATDKQASARVKSDETDSDANVSINVFPNPTTGIFNWKLVSNEPANLNLTLYDSMGKENLHQTSNTVSQIHEGTIDLKKMNDGVYFLKFMVGEKRFVRKIVKQ